MPPSRLSAVDASFLYLERPRTPMHVGAVWIFATPAVTPSRRGAVTPSRRGAGTPSRRGAGTPSRPGEGGFDYDRLVDTVERRLVAVPRYRQKVRRVPVDL